jgi:predicted nucleic acid-binding protein
LVTGVEVFQEILHRYAAIDRLDSVDPALASLESVTDQVLSFDVADVRAAKVLIELGGEISARDALHVAVMKRAGIDRIFSFDRGFDGFPDIQRVF